MQLRNFLYLCRVHSFTHMEFKYNDGGRSAFFKTVTNTDCVVRALAIITGLPYNEVWHGVEATGAMTRTGRVKTFAPAFIDYAYSLGLAWVDRADMIKNVAMPAKCAVQVRGHYAAIIGGVVHDTATLSELKKCYGYWYFAPNIKTATLFDVCSIDTGNPLNRAPLSAKCATDMQALLFNSYRRQTIIKAHE